MRSLLFILVLFLSACSYHWGFRDRALPGGYKQVAIPIFKNKTKEVGIENDFTNALVRRFERSEVAHVTSKDLAPVRIDGTLISLAVVANGSGIIGARSTTTPNSTPLVNPLPTDAVLNNGYQVHLTAKLVVVRQSDEKIIWQGTFDDVTNYLAPQIQEPVVNSADATYNESARHIALVQLADDMMLEAHDRITEMF